jgi:para-aminobenzoate synthetase component 1
VPPFQGGIAGFIAYDWGLTLERLPEPRFDDLGLPDTLLCLYDWVLAWDHATSQAWLISTGVPEVEPAARATRARARAEKVRSWLSRVGPHGDSKPLETPGREHQARPTPPAYDVEGGWWPSGLELRSSFTREGYLEAVARVREYIFAGDIFQANLSQRFEAPLDEPTWTLYRRLRTQNAAPFEECGAIRGLHGVSRGGDCQRITGAIPPSRCERPRRDAADQGHSSARPRT